MKRCTNCHEAKPLSAYSRQKDSKTGRYYKRAVCKACRVIHARSYIEKPEYQLRKREKSLRKLYGIGVDDYNTLFNNQDGRCFGCKRHQSEFIKALSVDHHHGTKAVRGLLCSGCNLAIGNVKENASTLRALADYLEVSL